MRKTFAKRVQKWPGSYMRRSGFVSRLCASHWAAPNLTLACCSLFNMMLIISPSWTFMCSISCSLLVDSNPQMQQQNSRTQYSVGNLGFPVQSFLSGIPVPRVTGSSSAWSFLSRLTCEISSAGSGATRDLIPKRGWNRVKFWEYSKV